MDNSNPPGQMNRQIDHLGVNKMGRNIKKSPLHQPNFSGAARQQPQPQPQVYNINKNDFRNVVQRLTGSPSQESPPRPPQNTPKPASNRLQKIRPPPLASMNRPRMPMHPPMQMPMPMPMPAPAPAHPSGQLPNNFARPPPPHPPPGQYGQPLTPGLPPTPPDVWSNTAESPISAYMRYLQNSIVDAGQRQPQTHYQPHVPGQNLAQPQGAGLLPNPHMQPYPSPRMNGTHSSLPSPRMNGPPLPPLPSPRMNGHFPPLPSPRMNGPVPPLPSPRANGPPPLLPSPTSQFLLPSPTGFLNMLSPRSPYPLLSPGYQFPPPLTPNFSFSSVPQSGILGPGPQLPPSPGYGFPLSPSGFYPVPSPRWRDDQS